MIDIQTKAIIGGLLAITYRITEYFYEGSMQRIRNSEYLKGYNATTLDTRGPIRRPRVSDATLRRDLRYYACHGSKKQFKLKYQQWRQNRRREKG